MHTLFIVGAFTLLSAEGSTQTKGISQAGTLARAYDAILDIRFDQARGDLRRACGPAPVEVCQTISAALGWWEILLDPANPARDADFLQQTERSIAATEAWTTRDPKRAEAWFFLGGAYAARAQLRVLRRQPLAAARDGKRIKTALEHAIELDPQLHDAYFGIGLYHYYADVAPTYAKLLRWVLLLPGGDKKRGLREMLQARERGALLRGEADYQLHIIHLWYERQPRQAIALLDGLRARYPRNPIFPQRIAEIHDEYLTDRTASLHTWRSLLEAAQNGRVAAAPLAATRARLGIAKQMMALSQIAGAVDVLKSIVADRPTAPYSALALAHLQLGAAYAKLGQRELALSSYQRALETTPRDDPYRVRTRAQRAIAEKF